MLGRLPVALGFLGHSPSVPSLPVAAIILCVSQHVANIDLVPIIVNGGDEAIFIAADVKNGEHANLISTGKSGTQVVEVREDFFGHRTIPSAEWVLSIWVFRPKLDQG